MKKILFPTEFSTHAPEVFQYALAIADTFNSKIVMVHALGDEQQPDKNLELESEKANSRLIALKEANQTTDIDHIETKIIVAPNLPTDAILEVASDQKVDLIVMGTQGKANAKEKYFGSVAAQVIGKTNCPILLIPQSAKFTGFKTLTCTTNFDFQDLQVLDTLCKWSKIFGAKINCVHVMEKGESIDVVNAKMQLLKDIFQDDHNIQFHVRSGDLKTAIELFVKNTNTDLLAMVEYHHSFYNRLTKSNITKGVAREIIVPLLILNEI